MSRGGGRIWGLGLGLVVGAGAAFVLWVIWPTGAPSRAPSPSPGPPAARTPLEGGLAAAVVPPTLAQYLPSNDPPATPVAGPPADCGRRGPAGAAVANAASLQDRVWSPFGRDEIGWEVYAPRIGQEIHAGCPPGSEGFAAALADWQAGHGLRPSGQLDPDTFAAMSTRWLRARPFVQVNARGVCPNAPALADLATAAPADSYGGKVILARPGALDALRRMREEARRAGVISARDPKVLTIFSGFRAPEADAARCVRDGNCQGLVRTICSAHRTGLALDLYIAQAPGQRPDSTDNANRLFMSRSQAYGWLLANGGRFGFVNYPFEPWHWEWTGEAMLPGVPISSLSTAGSEPLTPPPPPPAVAPPARVR